MKNLEGKVGTLYLKSGLKIVGYINKWNEKYIHVNLYDGNEFWIFKPNKEVLIFETSKQIKSQENMPDNIPIQNKTFLDTVEFYKTQGNYVTPTNIKVRSSKNDSIKEDDEFNNSDEEQMRKLLNVT